MKALSVEVRLVESGENLTDKERSNSSDTRRAPLSVVDFHDDVRDAARPSGLAHPNLSPVAMRAIFSFLKRAGREHPRTTGCLGAPVILGALGLLVLVSCHHVLSRERTAWMRETLPRLADLSITKDSIAMELRELRANVEQEEPPKWIGRNIVLMTNDQFLVYAYRHGANDRWPHHLLLARGSDGRWFYSSYHFCNELNMIRGDPQSGSIDEFVSRYPIAQFDGRSDECLKPTWP